MEGTAAASADFRRKERVFSIVCGGVLLAECVVRIVGAFTVPVDTMVWLGSVVLVGAVGVGIVVGGARSVPGPWSGCSPRRPRPVRALRVLRARRVVSARWPSRPWLLEAGHREGEANSSLAGSTHG
jgi:hypothetical protein